MPALRPFLPTTSSTRPEKVTDASPKPFFHTSWRHLGWSPMCACLFDEATEPVTTGTDKSGATGRGDSPAGVRTSTAGFAETCPRAQLSRDLAL
jgi:hypothetical protein